MNSSKAKQHFQDSIEHSQILIKRSSEYKSENGNICQKTQEIMKRSAIILLITAWETYIEDVCLEVFNCQYKCLVNSTTGNYLEKQCKNQINRLHNPDSVKVAKLFKEFFNVDITEDWVWNSYNKPDEVRKKLNNILEIRGEIAHRADSDKLPSKPEIEKWIRFVCELVDKTDEIIQSKILHS
ncbi:MAG: HEPN domain-containing protein [Pasteurella oralis]|uniref:HEPN domain-containing protein n=1 Tax=Pasteurella oralis TaxID=1071947 RepID=UPI002700D2BD|nr:HEPN domain-containing protein [Pasteurella oralis]